MAVSPFGTCDRTVTHTGLMGEFAGHGQQRGARVEPNRAAGTADASGDFSGDGAATATDVEDTFSNGDVE
jgi:hypothetical protein